MSKSIPAVKDYSIKFYKRGDRKPYAEIVVSAPTKFLAKLNARHCFGKKFYAALAVQGYERYTVGMVKSRNVSDTFDNSFASYDTDAEDQRAELLQEMLEDAKDDVGPETA